MTNREIDFSRSKYPSQKRLASDTSSELCNVLTQKISRPIRLNKRFHSGDKVPLSFSNGFCLLSLVFTSDASISTKSMRKLSSLLSINLEPSVRTIDTNYQQVNAHACVACAYVRVASENQALSRFG